MEEEWRESELGRIVSISEYTCPYVEIASKVCSVSPVFFVFLVCMGHGKEVARRMGLGKYSDDIMREMRGGGGGARGVVVGGGGAPP